MPRDLTQEDVLAAFQLKSILDSKVSEVHRVDVDAIAKRKTAESAYQTSVRQADDARDKVVQTAEAKRDKAIKAQDARVQDAAGIAKEAQQTLNESQDKVEGETGVRVSLPGGSPGAGATVRI